MTGWETDPEVNIGWRPRRFESQAFEIKKMVSGRNQRGQMGSVADRPPARTGTIWLVFANLWGQTPQLFRCLTNFHSAGPNGGLSAPFLRALSIQLVEIIELLADLLFKATIGRLIVLLAGKLGGKYSSPAA